MSEANSSPDTGSNAEKLVASFVEALGVAPELVRDELTYNTIPEWDSVGHMALVAAIEQTFDVMLDTDEIINMSSVAEAKKILVGHGIAFAE